MKKIFFFASIFIAINSFAKEWYQEKATLHQLTPVEWHTASDKNKLATAGDFIAVASEKKLLLDKINFTNMDQVKIFAQSLVKCIDIGTVDKKGNILESAKTQPISSISVFCMKLAGWLK